MDFSTSVQRLLDHWEAALLLATWAVIGVVAIQRRREWRSRRFAQQVNFSLNAIVEQGGEQTLVLRTLLEENATNSSEQESVRDMIREVELGIANSTHPAAP